MADNVVLNAGTGGDTVAADDVGGVKYQIVKLATGLLDTATLVSGSNPLPIGDNSGSLTVDNAGTFAVQATLAAETTKVIGTVNVAAAQTLATVTTVGTVSAVVPGVGATNLGKAEDAVHADGDTGVMALAVRRDANTTLAGATGDYAPIQVDASGNVKVAIISGAGSGGTAIADAAAFTRGTTSVTPIAGVVETSAPTLTNGNTGTVSLTTGGALRVDVTSGGIPGFAEDVAATSGDTGIVILGVRRDTAASSSGTDGDYSTLNLDSTGKLHVNVGNTVTVGSHAVTNAGTFVVQTGAATAGGATPVSTVSAASTNATSLKASAGQVYSVTASNINAAIAYLKFYNKASAPTVGTDTPVYVFPIPGNAAGAGVTHSFPCGLEFTTGIAWALTTGATVASTGAVAASEVIVSVGYK